MKFQGTYRFALFLGLSLPLLGANQSQFKVRPGDTLYSISRAHKITLQELQAANPSLSSDSLKPGQILKIPTASASTSTEKQSQKPSKDTSPNSHTTTSNLSSGSLAHPLNRPKLSPKKHYSSLTYAPHKGVLYPASSDASFAYSVQSGKVVAIDYMDGYGNYAILEHPNKLYSLYANLDKIHVTEGQTVNKKQKIADVQIGKGLYFQLNQKEKPIPPGEWIHE